MLPKSSSRVAEIIKIANAIAHDYDQEYVGTEHVLLAIEREGTGMGAAVLAKRGLTDELLREEIDKLVKKRLEETWVFGRLPGTPHFKNVVAVAIEQCQELGSSLVCTEHLLLGLLKERGSVAHKALNALGVSFEDARDDIQELMASA